ncbi:hypothetical protein ABH940_002104 [Streptacidiphilus sp. BW17]|uniref:MXAN_6230/SCO0854 family RING domain-containing protein n=1 Tax=Streptacidiphilus sp. BW17 TaxID=3156274 RepID=UPI0035195E02
MPATATTGPHAPSTAAVTRSLASVLLARRGVVHLPTAVAGRTGSTESARESIGVALLEADLLDRGYLLAGPLRDALASLGDVALAAAGRALLADVDAALGADRPHVPLFRGFPETVPADTADFYVRRVLTVLLQEPEQPCVLCGRTGVVLAVAPCAHLVCGACFDGAEFSACPICHRRIDPADPFLRPGRARAEADPERELPRRLWVLTFGGGADELAADLRAELAGLLDRSGALSPQDRDDLLALLDAAGRTDLSWLPAEIPGRETKALVLAWLLADPGHLEMALPEVTARLTTATDVLRLASVLAGGDAGLLTRPRLTSLRRPVRRALLTALDRLDPTVAAEEMRRYRNRWLPLAELLHVFEYAARYPSAALAVAALRQTRPTGTTLAETLSEGASAPLTLDACGRVSLPSWGRQVETALHDRDLPQALALLTRRPGELLRRLDLMLRLAAGGNVGQADDHTGAVLDAARAAVSKVSPAVLLSALGALRARLAPTMPQRVFFPKGGNAKAHIVADERASIPAEVVAAAVTVLTGEVARRAAAAPRVELAVLDAALDGIVAPFAERTASRALLTLPRGSELPVAEGRSVRLFLHWMEDEEHGRVDLDLALAMFDTDWKHVGTCDYTHLRFADSAAVHSGDLTSAPAPDGATEFADLDLDLLADTGVRYVVAVCFSFNNVAFDDMAEAFAGVMVRDQPGQVGEIFDPRAVEQRFDLVGRARASVPFVFDTAARTLRWLDVVQGVTGSDHAVHRHEDQLGLLARELTALYAGGARVGLGELAAWNAAARATDVALRHVDGTATRYTRRADEEPLAFARRIGSPDHDGSADELLASTPARLAYLLRGDAVRLAEDAEVYALYPASASPDAARVRLLTAADVVTALRPS